MWKPSEDLIENFPNGAVARRGPNKGIFAHDLNASAVFDIVAPNGLRLRGRVRAIQATDLATGRSVVLGIVRDSVPAEMLPPNRIVYSDAFDSEVLADIVLVWRHNFFAQETVLRSRPVLPAELNPETSRFEIVTEFIDVPDPELTELVSREPGGADLPDHVLIRFGRLNIIKGHAFPVDERNGVTMGASVAAMKGVPVVKQWQELEDGRKFLIESLSWTVLMQELDKLGIARAETARVSLVP